MIAGFVVMVITGALLFYAIPVRSYQSLWFRLQGDRADPRRAERLRLPRRHRPPRRASGISRRCRRRRRAAPALTSLVLWAIIVVAGRMIAYNWFDCDKQPQPHVVNVFAGCVVPPAGGGR